MGCGASFYEIRNSEPATRSALPRCAPCTAHACRQVDRHFRAAMSGDQGPGQTAGIFGSVKNTGLQLRIRALERVAHGQLKESVSRPTLPRCDLH